MNHDIKDVIIMENYEIIKKISEVLGRDKKKIMSFKTKSGFDLEVTGKISSFVHNGEPHIASRIISYKKEKSEMLLNTS